MYIVIDWENGVDIFLNKEELMKHLEKLRNDDPDTDYDNDLDIYVGDNIKKIKVNVEHKINITTEEEYE